MKLVYMHTLSGRPAEYDGEQVVFVNQHTRGLTAQSMFKDSLGKIRTEQYRSRKWRREQGFPDENKSIYGYIKIRVPEDGQGPLAILGDI